MKHCQEKALNFMCWYYFKKVESTFRNVQRMKFIKHGANSKCLMSVIKEDIDEEECLNEEQKKGMSDELALIVTMDDNDLSQDHLMSLK